MPTEENTPASTDADYYGTFIVGLLGLLDDARLSAYSEKGIAHLEQARIAFWAEFEARHPGAWGQHRPPADTQP